MESKIVLAKNLKRIRKSSGKTQAEFAAFVGLTQRGYGKIERGDTHTTLDRIDMLANALGVHPSELLKEV